ncbi:hypothetical protein C2S53_018066 [Perilla frutescens var. hirtella]|uniref:Uncharacterized protein n=1 Tax=Perilla frutescens var. hirtella TaxID=608512 RepID=A0AAD4P7K9_PERFH|nr:hypothetical protein C2S53_018066 [Perilla frutescens var. hirtella]
MNEVVVLEKDLAMEEGSTNIPNNESLVRQTQQLIDKMTERETELNEGRREFVDHAGKLTYMAAFAITQIAAPSLNSLPTTVLKSEHSQTQLLLLEQKPKVVYALTFDYDDEDKFEDIRLINARSELSMSSNSILLMHFDTDLLYEIVDDAKKCEKVFAVKNLIVVLEKEKYKVMEKQLVAEQVSTMGLTKIKEITERAKDDGLIAILNVMRTINELTTAAIAYGLDGIGTSSGKNNVLIFDLGGGTFYVSLVRIEDANFKMKAITSDTHLGDEHFDNRMVNHFVEDLKLKTHQKDTGENPRALKRLKRTCEREKMIISSTTEIKFEIESLFDGIDVIPKVQQLMQGLFNGKEFYKIINLEEAVAHGVAVKATILSCVCNEKVQDWVLIDIIPLSLGIGYLRSRISALTLTITIIPIKKESNNSTTSCDNQTSGWMMVHEGESSMASDNNLSGKFVLANIPPTPISVVEIKVCFDIDANGILKVSAKDKRSRQEDEITITNNKKTLLKKEMKMMVRETHNKYKREEDHS